MISVPTIPRTSTSRFPMSNWLISLKRQDSANAPLFFDQNDFCIDKTPLFYTEVFLWVACI